MADQPNSQPPAGDAAQGAATAGTDTSAAAAAPGSQEHASLLGADGDTAAVDAKDGEAAAAAEAKPAEPVIPETYAFEMPDGQSLDAKAIEAMTPVFRDVKLTQEAAQKVVSTFAQYAAQAEAQRETEFQAFMETERAAHTAAIRKEWGGDFDANLATAQRAIGRFATPAFKQLLKDTGLANHAEFLKVFLPIGRMIQSDNPPNPSPGASGKKSLAEVLYGGNA